MATVRFEPNFKAFADMAVGPELRAAVFSIVEGQARPIAEGIAEDFAVTHKYADSFNTRTEIVDIGDGPHVAGILENDSDRAAAVEWGNSNDHRPHRVLGRTLGALGG